jgi:hypothetical protein
VVFEQGQDGDRTRLLVADDGKVSFHPVLRAPESPTTGETTEADAQVIAPPSTPSGASQEDRDHPTTGSRSEAGEPETVQLVGRLGRDPWFKTQGDAPIGGFPLAVNDPNGGNTTWHKVVVFGDAAEGLQEASRRGQIRKGRLVDVTGQTVVRQEKTDRGTRTSHEFHASAVIRVTATEPQSRRRSR